VPDGFPSTLPYLFLSEESTMRKSLTMAAIVTCLTSVSVSLRGQEKPAAQPSDEAVARTRQTVQMLDNVYKQTIVLITEKYVHDESDFAAGSAAVELFARIGEGGSHTVQLLDATGEPYEPNNVASDEFEREGIRRLKEGKEVHEQVSTRDGKPVLRVMTPVPVVLKKCIMCHSHYADAKDGEPIGALSYEVPIR
jgi:hypothetical protein